MLCTKYIGYKYRPLVIRVHLFNKTGERNLACSTSTVKAICGFTTQIIRYHRNIQTGRVSRNKNSASRELINSAS